jgi:hypothetical protein
MSRRAVIAIALASLVWLAAPAPSSACTFPPEAGDDPTYVGVSLVSVDTAGRWTGRWLGAHPLACDGDTYVLAFASESWATLRGLMTSTSEPLLIGDLPYAGDGACIVGTARRWWSRAALADDGASMRWEPASVPPSAPAPACPVNQNADGPLVLHLTITVP